MKRFLIIALMLSLVLPSVVMAIPEPYEMLKGNQMIPVGGPWLPDNGVLYFGDDKDGALWWNTTTGALDMTGLTAYDNTSLAIESGEDLSFVGGDSAVDFSLGSGTFKAPAGISYLNELHVPSDKTVLFGGLAYVKYLKANTSIYSAGTIKSDALATLANVKSNATIYAVTTLNSGGTATLNAVVANTTVNAAADGIRANSIILPGEMVITVPLTKDDFAAGEMNRSIFIADDAWTITSIEEVHNVAEATATTLPLSVQKMTGTQALTGGINVTNGAFNLKSTANTVVTGTLSTTVGGVGGRTTLADGNRLGIICNLTGTNAMSEFRGGLLTIHMKRV